jgi:hypothetical protein
MRVLLLFPNGMMEPWNIKGSKAGIDHSFDFSFFPATK